MQHSYPPLLLDRMWVRELSHAQPCSKTVLFISSVTLLCNASVCMCTVGGRGGPAGGQNFCWLCGPRMCFPCVCVCRSTEASPADGVTERVSRVGLKGHHWPDKHTTHQCLQPAIVKPLKCSLALAVNMPPTSLCEELNTNAMNFLLTKVHPTRQLSKAKIRVFIIKAMQCSIQALHTELKHFKILKPPNKSKDFQQPQEASWSFKS